MDAFQKLYNVVSIIIYICIHIYIYVHTPYLMNDIDISTLISTYEKSQDYKENMRGVNRKCRLTDRGRDAVVGAQKGNLIR